VYLIVVALLMLPAVFLLPETRQFDLLRGADKAQPAESAHRNLSKDDPKRHRPTTNRPSGDKRK